jgi:primase-polymerase (primpol)-like protein
MYQESVSAQAEAESSPALNSGFGEATQTHLVDLRDLLAVQQMDERGARWVNWRAVVNEHKLDKVPVRPNGINADVTRKAHCAPLEACLEAVRRDPSIAGIGYVIAAPRDLEAGLEPIVGVDLDSCRNRETGEIGAWAHEIINAFSSYAEVSPSGTGVKILALVDPSTRLIGGKRVIQTAAGTEHPKQVEVYVDGRFFTITGQILDWVPDELVDATAAYERLTTTITPFKTKNETRVENFTSDGEEPSAETMAAILGCRFAKQIWEGRKVTGDVTASGLDASLAASLGACKGRIDCVPAWRSKTVPIS